jgi:hypothetical protein
MPPAAFADVLVDALGWSVTPRGDLSVGDHLRPTRRRPVGRRAVIAVTGSRSREPDYLARIQAAISSRDLLHYRVLYGLPRHGALKTFRDGCKGDIGAT